MTVGERKAGLTRTKSAIYLACTALMLLVFARLHSASAQNERHGLRVRYTSITSAGGLEGRAFLPVSSKGVSERASENAACNGQRVLTVDATLHRGAMRGLKLQMPTQKIGRVAMVHSGCALVEIEATLEDGSVLKGGQGYIELQSLPSTTDPTFRGTFAQTTSLRDSPITIEGNFVVPAAKASAKP